VAGTSGTYTGPVSTFTVTVPAASEIFAGKSDADQYNGVAYLVFYNLSGSGGSPNVNSFVRIVVSATTKPSKNQNPVIASINMNDSPMATAVALPGSAVNLSSVSAAGSAETYLYELPSGAQVPKLENLVNTWFVSDGTMEYQRTFSNAEDSWSPPSSHPAGRGSVIVVVTRDGRDGAAYQKIDLD